MGIFDKMKQIAEDTANGKTPQMKSFKETYQDEMQKTNDKAKAKFEPFLLENEVIENIWSNGVEFVAITNYRLFATDKFSENPKTVQVSVPIFRISMVAAETGGFLNWSKTVIIYVGSVKIKVDLYDKGKAIDFFNYINKVIVQTG